MNSLDCDVLVVEPEDDLRKGLGRLIENAGYHVSTTPTAISALEKIEKGHFKVVFIDHDLVGLSGNQLLSKIKLYWPDINVIITKSSEDLNSQLQRHCLDGYQVFLKSEASQERLNRIMKQFSS